jgi:hypothetical protein
MISKTEGPNIQELISPLLIPDHQRMIVPLPSNILIGPLILLRFIDSERLLILLQRIGIIAQFESMIIIPPPLHHTQRPSIRKSLYLRNVQIISYEVLSGCDYTCLLFLCSLRFSPKEYLFSNQ